MKTFGKFILFVVLLNIVRYLVGGVLESILILEGMFGVMSKFPGSFNADFSGTDFAISFFYNFMLWFSAAAVFYVSYPALKGGFILRSLKAYGLMCLFFISLTAIYMNHFVPPIRPFFVYSILDALILFPIVGLANGLLFPLIFKSEIRKKEPGF